MRFPEKNPTACMVLAGALALMVPGGTGTAQELGKDEVIARFVEAVGGAEAIDGLETLSFRVVSPAGRSLDWEIERPNRVRKERENDLILVFDGQRAGFLQRRLEDGSMAGPSLVPPEDWHHFEMDVALYVPAFLDYPSQYQGLESVGGEPTHLLSVQLPMGGVAEYAIHAESYLPVSVRLPGWDYERILGGFERVDGLLLPTRFWSGSDPEAISSIEGWRLNTVFPEGRFTPVEGDASPAIPPQI